MPFRCSSNRRGCINIAPECSLFHLRITLSLLFIGRIHAAIPMIGNIWRPFRAELSDPNPKRPVIARNRGHGDLMAHHLLDADEAAQVLKMDSRTLVRWARLGHVPAHPMGEGKRKLWRFLEHELLEWLEARKPDKKRPMASTMEIAISAHARRSA